MSAAPDQQPPVKGPGGGTPPRPDETRMWDALLDGWWPRDSARWIGIHPKRVRYLCEKWSRQGRYDYGVTCDLGWPEPLPDGWAPRVVEVAPILHTLPKTVVYPPPPPPPFGGASMAVRVAMTAPFSDPAMRDGVKRANKAVTRDARAAADRIVAAVDPPPMRSTTPAEIVYGLLSRGQVFITAPRRRAAMTHFTVHEDGRITDNRAAMAFDLTHTNRRIGW